MSSAYDQALELKEALPGFALLYALGYFGNVFPVTKRDLAARFTRPADNSQMRRGCIGIVSDLENRLIDELMDVGENGDEWRAAHSEGSLLFGSLAARMPTGRQRPDMVELRKRVFMEPNPWTGVFHFITDYDPRIHRMRNHQPAFVRGSLVDAAADDDEWDLHPDGLLYCEDVHEIMRVLEVDLGTAQHEVEGIRAKQRAYGIRFQEALDERARELLGMSSLLE